jgi:hypothetical protein
LLTLCYTTFTKECGIVFLLDVKDKFQVRRDGADPECNN